MNLRNFYLRQCYWIKDFLSGQKMWKHYKDIIYISDNKNIIDGEKKRKQYISSILSFASTNVLFYQPYKGLELKDYPI